VVAAVTDVLNNGEDVLYNNALLSIRSCTDCPVTIWNALKKNVAAITAPAQVSSNYTTYKINAMEALKKEEQNVVLAGYSILVSHVSFVYIVADTKHCLQRVGFPNTSALTDSITMDLYKSEDSVTRALAHDAGYVDDEEIEDDRCDLDCGPGCTCDWHSVRDDSEDTLEKEFVVEQLSLTPSPRRLSVAI
jgi:hypothetical protein